VKRNGKDLQMETMKDKSAAATHRPLVTAQPSFVNLLVRPAPFTLCSFVLSFSWKNNAASQVDMQCHPK